LGITTLKKTVDFYCSPATRFGHLSDTSKKAKRTSAVSTEHYISNEVFVSREAGSELLADEA
jgi:hypothetical protein